MSVGLKMTAIANEIRELSGTTSTMGLDAMATHLNTANVDVDDQTVLISQLKSLVDILPEADGVSDVRLQEKNVIPTISVQSITPDIGYHGLSKVTVAGDANLVASNIKSGVSIFGVSGTVIEDTGEPSSEDAILNGTIKSYSNDAIEVLKYGAFASCSSLTTVDLPNATRLGSIAFYGCTNLTTINALKTTRIEYSTFESCYKLSSINFPNATYLGPYAFMQCMSLTNANFPLVTSMGSAVFRWCYNITNANFPMATSAPVSLFDGCSKLTSVNIPSATVIGSYAFNGCSGLTSVSFPLATNIDRAAFAKCSGLTSVNFPMTSTIGSCVFQSCSNMTTISLPNASIIYNQAFQDCYKLSQLYLAGSSVCTLSASNAFMMTPYAGYSSYFSGTPRIYVPASLLTSYQNATNWAYFSSYFSAI